MRHEVIHSIFSFSQAFPVIPQQPLKLPPEELSKQCQHILDNLSGSKESIKVHSHWALAPFPHVPKVSKDWILLHMENIDEICQLFKIRAKELVEPIKKLHLVYLINDVLLHTYFQAF